MYMDYTGFKGIIEGIYPKMIPGLLICFQLCSSIKGYWATVVSPSAAADCYVPVVAGKGCNWLLNGPGVYPWLMIHNFDRTTHPPAEACLVAAQNRSATGTCTRVGWQEKETCGTSNCMLQHGHGRDFRLWNDSLVGCCSSRPGLLLEEGVRSKVMRKHGLQLLLAEAR